MTDRRISAAEELARRLATPAGLRAARLRQAAATLALPTGPAEDGRPASAALPARGAAADAATAPSMPPPSTDPGGPAAAPDPAAETPRPISIWHPERRDGETAWVRPAPQPLGDHYAAARELTARRPGGPRRLCFFGESAAAGYLYAPHLTPARVLEAQLATLAGPGRWEVVDLARTNERLATLAATVEASLQLQPDLLVIYAGNNWTLLETPELSPFAPSVTSRQRLAAALREGGAEG
ncbi:MAG TPA: hypothetical protein VHQ65_11535, partial [Thermoanaerobaculia bacterium]|nr:hypothetical protein [Thermoanaerobaculia bacterium]